MNNTVPFYDNETKTITQIPAAELAPGTLHANVEGIGCVWIDRKKVKINTCPFHPPFPTRVRELLRQIKASLDEVWPRTLEDWEHGFRCELNPDKEIAFFLLIAALYKRCTVGKQLSRLKKDDYFHVLVRCIDTGGQHVLEVVELYAITRKEAEKAIHMYRESLGEGGLAHKCWLKSCAAFGLQTGDE